VLNTGLLDLIRLKTLVVYYSRIGNARFVAQTIAAEVGADIEEVMNQKKRSGPTGFFTGDSDAIRGKETKISPTTKGPTEYDLIIVGTPVWASRPTPAITTSLKNNDLSTKKVSLFLTR